MSSNTYAQLEALFKEKYSNGTEELRKKLTTVKAHGIPRLGQRDFENTYVFGHDHDFGLWQEKGVMSDRHIRLPAQWVDMGWLPRDLTDKTVIVVGDWCGGMSLMLAAMGAHIECAFDPVPTYAQTAFILHKHFQTGAHVETGDLYAYAGWGLDLPLVDYVILAGVLYHLSDPVVGLRICRDMLKPTGQLFLETEYAPGDGCHLVYEGPTKVRGTLPNGARLGWNWFLPTQGALAAMLRDAGFKSRVRPNRPVLGPTRLTTYARKNPDAVFVEAGTTWRQLRESSVDW